MWHPIRRILDFKTRVPVVFRYIKLSKDLKRFDTCTTWEVEYPYRKGLAMVYRVVGKHGFQLAVLDNHPDLSDDAIDDRLFAAIHSAEGPVEFQAETWRKWTSRAGRHLENYGRSVALPHDERREVYEMLGVASAFDQADSDQHADSALERN